MSIKQVAKQLSAALVAVVTVAFVTTTAHAFTSVNKSTVTAIVSVGGTGAAAIYSVTVKTIGGNVTVSPSTITWTGANAPSAGDGFKISDDYIQLNSTTTTSGSGVRNLHRQHEPRGDQQLEVPGVNRHGGSGGSGQQRWKLGPSVGLERELEHQHRTDGDRSEPRQRLRRGRSSRMRDRDRFRARALRLGARCREPST